MNVRFRPLLTTHVNICESRIKKYFSFTDFFAKIYALLTHVRKTPPLSLLLLLNLVYLADSSNMQQQSSIHKYDSTMMTIKDHVHCQARHPWNINSDLFLIISFRKYPVSEIPNKGPKFLHEISRIFKYILHNSFTWKWIPIF